MDTKLKRYTTFHPQTNGKTKVVNRALVNILSSYNQKHPKIWDGNLIYIQHPYITDWTIIISISPLLKLALDIFYLCLLMLYIDVKEE